MSTPRPGRRKAKVVKTVRNGSLFLDIQEYSDGRYGFDWEPSEKDRQQVRKKNLADAVAKARDLLGASQAGKLDLLNIDPEEFREFLKWKAERREKVRVSQLVAAFLTRKRAKGLSFWTVRDLEFLDKFAESFPGYLDSITSDDVMKWLDARDVGPRRWNNILAAVKSLFKFARTERYLPAEKHPVELIEKKKASTKIQTYTPEELEKMLAVVPEIWLPAIVLGAFAGLRPEEICPDPRTDKRGLCWENILWDKRKIDVPKHVAKDGRRRFVPLHDATIAFLGARRGSKGPVVPRKRLSHAAAKWVEASGVAWKDDGWRHSYASYRLAVIKDIQELSLEMGNSPKMIHDSYLDLKHEDEAAAWFAVRPCQRLSKIVSITAA